MKANMAVFFTKFNTLKVSVKEQYLIYDVVALISSIGGTLGICIGFSFVDTINTLLSYVQMGIDCIKARRQTNQSSPLGSVKRKDKTTVLRPESMLCECKCDCSMLVSHLSKRILDLEKDKRK